jgi:hypothetical protein
MVDVVVVTTSVVVVIASVVVGGKRVPVGGADSVVAQPARTRAPASRAARSRFTALPPFTFALVPEEKADNYH